MAEEKNKIKVEEKKTEKVVETKKEEKPKMENQKKVEEKKESEKTEVKTDKDKKTDIEEKTDKDKKKETEKTEDGKKTEKKEETKKAEEKSKVVVKPKKTEAVVKAKNVPISKKHSMAICDFIRNKEIGQAIEELEQVMIFKRAIPMKGEIPHRKGKGMMSGRFPVKSVGNFLVLLKSLAGNATYNSIDEPVIVEAVANMGVRPHGRFGRVRKKSTHVTLVAKNQIRNKKSGGKK